MKGDLRYENQSSLGKNEGENKLYLGTYNALFGEQIRQRLIIIVLKFVCKD